MTNNLTYVEELKQQLFQKDRQIQKKEATIQSLNATLDQYKYFATEELTTEELECIHQTREFVSSNEFLNNDAIQLQLTSLGRTIDDPTIQPRQTTGHIFNPKCVDEDTNANRFLDHSKQNSFCGFLGQNIHKTLAQHTASTSATLPLNTMSDLQMALCQENSPLWHLTHGLGTGKLEPPMNNENFRKTTKKQKRGAMGSFTSFSALLAAVSDHNANPVGLYTRNLTTTHSTPARVKQGLVRTGASKKAYTNNDTKYAKSIRSVPTMNALGPFDINENVQDNCGFTATVSHEQLFMDFTVVNKAVYSPHQIWHWFSIDFYLKMAEEHVLPQADAFKKRYRTVDQLALARKKDYEILDLAEKDGINTARHALDLLASSDRNWEEKIRDGDEDAASLIHHQKKLQKVVAAHAWAAGVSGVPDDNTVTLPDGSFANRPKNSSKKCKIFRDNNVRSHDVVKLLNGASADIKNVGHSMMNESYLGDPIENNAIGTSVPTGHPSLADAISTFNESGFDGERLSEHDIDAMNRLQLEMNSNNGHGGEEEEEEEEEDRHVHLAPPSAHSMGSQSIGGRRRKQNNLTQRRMKTLIKLRAAAKKLGGRALVCSDNAPALIWCRYRDTPLHKLHCRFYSGGFHMLKKVLKSTGSLFQDFMNEMIKPFRNTASEAEYYRAGADPRQRWWEEPWYAIGVRISMIQGYRNSLSDGSSNNSTSSTTTSSSSSSSSSSSAASSSPPSSDDEEWRKVVDYAHGLAKKRPSLFPVLFWLRSCDVATMLRSCGKKAPEGDFELYRQLNRLSRHLFATTNSMKYIRVTYDHQVFLETCSKFDYLIAKYIAFCGRTSKGNACFKDELQEKFVQICRILSGGGASGKRYNSAVEGNMRVNVQKADELMYQIQQGMKELEEQEVVACDVIESAVDVDAQDSYDGESTDISREQEEESKFSRNPWRTQPLTKESIRGLQLALRGGWFDHQDKYFCDCRGRVIADHSFVSLVDSSPLNPDRLAECTIQSERLIQYCEQFYGPWPTTEEQDDYLRRINRKKSSRSSSSSSNYDPVEPAHGPTMTVDGNFCGPQIRTGDTSLFNLIPNSLKQINRISEVFDVRRTTTEPRTIMRLSNFLPSVSMKCFTTETLVEELVRVRRDWGKHNSYKTKIMSVLGKDPIIKDGGTAKEPGKTKKELCKMLVDLRKKGVPISKFLQNDGPKISVTKDTSTGLFRRKGQEFKYMEQRFVQNLLRGAAAKEASQLAPVVDVSEEMEEEEEEVAIVQEEVSGAKLLLYLSTHKS